MTEKRDEQRVSPEGWRGRFFEDMEVGDVYKHPLGGPSCPWTTHG